MLYVLISALRSSRLTTDCTAHYYTHSNTHDVQSGGTFLQNELAVVCPSCPLFNVLQEREAELFEAQYTVVLSLAHSTRRQEAAEAGERNSCKGDD